MERLFYLSKVCVGEENSSTLPLQQATQKNLQNQNQNQNQGQNQNPSVSNTNPPRAPTPNRITEQNKNM